METTWKDLLHAAAWGAASAVVLTIGFNTAEAAAVDLDQRATVDYLVCGDGVAAITFVDEDGDLIDVVDDLSTGCWGYELYNGADGYGYPAGTSFAGVLAVDDNGGTVACTITVDGDVVASDVDVTDYYSFASCD
ncbi:hypothetical protein SEA_CLOWN_6 [Gordonia phage Clown]|uniref:Uncharacterized protein n=1 Tax=Gordonia phage Clown TaxID=2759393 RepID=A0A7L7SPW5_9CAUD|nr:hypothetical protein KNV25_gp06 [Gordonia phage Clown]QOC56004.1 hypothetical protein SEA_CLOWN_6 [Gordonia phage Clown]